MLLLGLAAIFAVINGANDGGAMVASTLRVPGQRPITTIAALSVALVAVPLLFGTGVADTLTSGLVQAPDDGQAQLIAVGVIAAIGVVAILTRLGLPTSLTLAVVGGIVGAGIGRGLPVVAGGVIEVLLVGVAAPVVGAVLARLLGQLSSAVLAAADGRGLAALGWMSLAVQAIAYAANDGQKMLAVLMVTAVGLTAPAVIGLAVLFAMGIVVGAPSAAGTLGRGLAGGGPHEEVAAQLGGSVAVLTSATLGAPVSMTQAVSGGLIGSGLGRGLRQIRWRRAGQLAVAWVLTLPSGALAGFVIGTTWAGVT